MALKDDTLDLARIFWSWPIEDKLDVVVWLPLIILATMIGMVLGTAEAVAERFGGRTNGTRYDDSQ